MSNVKVALDAWRDASRRRDSLAPGSTEWQEAQEAVRGAATVFHAEEAQEYARYAEEAFQGQLPWSAQLERRTSGASSGQDSYSSV